MKIELTTREFLSIYCGVVLTESFNGVIVALEKLAGKGLTTLGAISVAENFRDYIKDNRKDVDIVLSKIKKPYLNNDRLMEHQIDEFILEFKKEFGDDKIEIDLDEYNNYSYTNNLMM